MRPSPRTFTRSYLDALGREPNLDERWSDGETAALIARGFADGTIDPRMPAAWFQQLLWSLIACGAEYVRQGAPKHEALALTLDSLRRLAARPGGDRRQRGLAAGRGMPRILAEMQRMSPNDRNEISPVRTRRRGISSAGCWVLGAP